MTFLRKLTVALFCAALAAAPLVAAPHSAEARAGWTSRGYSSMGSMGSQTYNFNGGSTINRSMTPYSNPSYGGRYGGYGGYGYGGYHPFWSGLAGGLFGGWLGSMLFPHWGMGYGGYGYGGGMGWGGGFFSILIWLFVLWLGWRLFRGFFHGFGGGGFGGPMSGPGPGMGRGTGMGFGGGLMSGGPGAVGYGGPAPGQTIEQIPVTPIRPDRVRSGVESSARRLGQGRSLDPAPLCDAGNAVLFLRGTVAEQQRGASRTMSRMSNSSTAMCARPGAREFGIRDRR